MLEALFESQIKERILLYLLKNSISYPRELAKNFKYNLYSVQNQLKKLENAGILYSQLKGKIRIYGFNPRYPFKKELSALLEKTYEFLSEDIKEEFFIKRTRPRKAGKP